MAAKTSFFSRVVKNSVEFRLDPLTEQQTRINPARAQRPKQGEVDSGFDQIIKSSQERCPFCPERIMEKVPLFPEEITKEGRIKRGETVVFPNLNPFGEFHAVGTISDAHFLPMEGFHPKMLSDTVLAAQHYIKCVTAAKLNHKYPVFVWNYLPPSAGSIIHPHIQMLVEEDPVPELQKIFSKSELYYKTNKTNYWSDLIDLEIKANERYIGGNSSVQVLSSWAPRGSNEILFVFPGVSTFASLNEQQVFDFTDALARALKGYQSMGIGSFNLVSFSGPVGSKSDSFTLHLKLISRPAPKGVYTNDTGPMERMYDAFVIDAVPEKLNEIIKPFFSK